MIATKLIRCEIAQCTIKLYQVTYSTPLIFFCLVLHCLIRLKALLDVNHNNRRTAEECFIILGASYEVYLRDAFDIFFSHPWEDKPFLKLIYR